MWRTITIRTTHDRPFVVDSFPQLPEAKGLLRLLINHLSRPSDLPLIDLYVHVTG